MVQHVQALPCVGRRRRIDESQQNSGENLQEQQGESRAAEHVPPARGVARNLVQDHFLYRSFKLGAALEPVVNTLTGRVHPRHGESPSPNSMFTSFAELESVGIWPAKMCSS